MYTTRHVHTPRAQPNARRAFAKSERQSLWIVIEGCSPFGGSLFSSHALLISVGADVQAIGIP
jgi:hypothetical protein